LLPNANPHRANIAFANGDETLLDDDGSSPRVVKAILGSLSVGLMYRSY